MARRVGIVGGGQLARMMLQKARKLGLDAVVLDPDPRCPAASLADEVVTGSPMDDDALRTLAERVDVVTFDIEAVAPEPLVELAARGHRILPSPQVLATIQDKYAQRVTFERAGIPGPRFIRLPEGRQDLVRGFGLPAVQKLRRGGYDGRGVLVLDTEDDLERLLPGDALLEEKVAIEHELSVMVARSEDGDERSYPVAMMRMRPGANVLEALEVPACVDERTAEHARQIACRAVASLDGVGVFGVELFVDPDGGLFLNEVAPRPHNSGHYTIEASATCQFEQHLRAVTGLPLGSTELLRPAVMINLLGHGSHTPTAEELSPLLEIEGVALHLYGKREGRPGRKLGHVTAIGATLDEARDRARRARRVLDRLAGEDAA